MWTARGGCGDGGASGRLRRRPRRGGGGHIGSRPRDVFVVRLLENGRPRRDQGVDRRDAQLVDHQRAVAWRHGRNYRAKIYGRLCMRRLRAWRRLLPVVSRGVETLSHHRPCSASSVSGGLSRSNRPVSSTSLYTCERGRRRHWSPVMASVRHAVKGCRDSSHLPQQIEIELQRERRHIHLRRLRARAASRWCSSRDSFGLTRCGRAWM